MNSLRDLFSSLSTRLTQRDLLTGFHCLKMTMPPRSSERIKSNEDHIRHTGKEGIFFQTRWATGKRTPTNCSAIFRLLFML